VSVAAPCAADDIAIVRAAVAEAVIPSVTSIAALKPFRGRIRLGAAHEWQGGA